MSKKRDITLFIADETMSNEQSIINTMFGKNAIIEIGKIEIEGTLLGSKMSVRKRPHQPEILIVETDGTKILIRGWVAIKTKERVITH